MKNTFVVQAWLVWLLSAAVLTLIVRNPLYLVIILLSARIVVSACGTGRTVIKISFWRLSLVILVFSVLFNLLLAHVGRTVLFELPRSLWLIGGPLTLEAAIYGVLSALVLITLLAVFLTFNELVPTGDLVSLMPRALSSVGIVILIAVTYVPETLQQLERVREAQALRGHRIRGFRDWRPIFIPLLVGALERSMNLAETMVARGYGETAGRALRAKTRLLLFAGLVLSFGGWLLSFRVAPYGWMLIIPGGLVLAAAYLEQGKKSKRTRYQVTRWQTRDWLLILTALLPLLLFTLPVSWLEKETLAYSPYPLAAPPAFDPVLGLALALLAAPALLIELGRSHNRLADT